MTEADHAELVLRCEYSWSISRQPLISIAQRGAWVAISSEDGSVYVMLQNKQNQVIKLDSEALGGETTSVCFRSQNSLLVSIGESVHELHIKHIKDGKDKETLSKSEKSWPVSTEEINCICVLDHRRLAVADDSGAVSILNMEQAVVKSFSPRLCHAQMCTSLTYQTKSGCLFSGGMDCKIKQWNIKTKSLVDEFDINILRSSDQLATQFNPPYVNCLTSNDENMCAGLGDGSILVFRRSSRSRPGEEQYNFLTGHTLAVNAISLTADGQSLISGSNDKTCRIWSLTSLQCTAIYRAKYKINTITALINGALVGDVGGFLTKLTW